MFRRPESKIVSRESLGELVKKLHASGKKIVTTNGCFDLLHWGHIAYLCEARGLGSILICGLNSDISVKKIKGPSRPLVDENTRLLQVAGLEAVDYVTLFPEGTPEAFLEIVRPHFHVKGGDYRPEDLPEKAVVEKHGGQVKCLKMVPGFSTTELVNKLVSLRAEGEANLE